MTGPDPTLDSTATLSGVPGGTVDRLMAVEMPNQWLIILRVNITPAGGLEIMEATAKVYE
jgi:hypothetical protein